MKDSVPTKKDDINRTLRGATSEIRTLLRLAHDQNFKVAPTSKGHFSVSTPEGVRPKVMVFAPKTPSDTRGVHRVVRKLRHIGVDIPRG